MKNNTLIFITILIVLALGGLIYYQRGNPMPVSPTPPMVVQDSVKGCYVAHLSKDVYTLSITTEAGENVSGTLAFKNFEKDSSSGTFTGTYKNGILLGNYSFNSEGMHSDRQVIFKKVGDSFVEGFGEVTVVGNEEMFKDVANVSYDPNSTFVKSDSCI